MQVCESEGYKLGANWYQSVSDERAQDTIVEEERRKIAQEFQRRLSAQRTRKLVKSFQTLYSDYMQLLIWIKVISN